MIQLGKYRFWAFSYRNNSYGFEVVAYDGAKMLGHMNVSGARYLEGAQVDRRAQLVAFIGQSGREGKASFAELQGLVAQSGGAPPAPELRGSAPRGPPASSAHSRAGAAASAVRRRSTTARSASGSSPPTAAGWTATTRPLATPTRA